MFAKFTEMADSCDEADCNEKPENEEALPVNEAGKSNFDYDPAEEEYEDYETLEIEFGDDESDSSRVSTLATNEKEDTNSESDEPPKSNSEKFIHERVEPEAGGSRRIAEVLKTSKGKDCLSFEGYLFYQNRPPVSILKQ